MDSSNTFAAANAAFLAFLRENGAEVSPSIDIHDYSSQHAGRGHCSHQRPRRRPHALHSAALVHAQTSKWKPYFDILPTSFETPVFWPEPDLALLEGTDVPRRMSLEESRSLFENVLLPIIQEHASEDDLPKFTLDKYLYAGSLLMAYGFNIGSLIGTPDDEEEEEEDTENADEGLPVIVPLADTLNAIHPPSAHLERDPKNPNVLVMRTSAAVAKGCQVFNTYGDHGSNELLRRYGYVEWTNEFDSVVVEGPAVVQAVARAIKDTWAKDMSDDKLESVLEKRIDDLAEFDVYDDEFELSVVRPVPADLVLTIKLLLLTPDEYKRAKKHPHSTFPTLNLYTQADPTERVLGAPIHLTALESNILIQVVNERLAEYPTSKVTETCARIQAECTGLDEYISRVCSEITDGSLRLAYACYVRASERRLLQGALSRVAVAKKVDQWPSSEQDAIEQGSGKEAEAELVIVGSAYEGLVKESAAVGGKKDKKGSGAKKRGADGGASSSSKAKKAKKST
ncbi:hypothetical protein BCR44DRAFT_1433785 [Catenaria anguillulae PL171]|uniref:SET domain-containing protein n=1 Tax=Catenaria anguillulae PL171 TaxID=765915 RepID=A0A1Y2HLY0_9FUNG|nr:hypothetical protein BCR44DRAFT_1433785 [Catenaria anguillulae PL171]